MRGPVPETPACRIASFIPEEVNMLKFARFPSPLLCAFALVLFSCSAAFAQFEAGSVQGTVQDSTGAAIPNASVELKSHATNVARKTTSNSTGEWVFVAVQPGSYIVTAKMQGMHDESRSFQLSVG